MHIVLIIIGAIVIGGLTDGFMGGFTGVIVGAIVGFLLAEILKLRGQMAALQRRVDRLEISPPITNRKVENG